MSPQFVDFDADGHLDIVCGIFDGSPHVARGDGNGRWHQPQTILDQHGDRIVLNMFWDFGEKQWVTTDRCDPLGGAPAKGHLTSTIAMDVDGDGDLDLVLGDHDGGYVYVRRNQGSNAEPKFATFNELLFAGDRPMRDPGTVATLRSVDWNGDGRLDLMVSGMGDPYGEQTGGGVVVYLDEGDGKGVRFAKPTTLIAASEKGWQQVTRPDVGLHPEAVDYDGDGDLDLIVGGYSQWTPVGPELHADERAELSRLKATIEQLTRRFLAMNKEMLKAQQGLSREAAREVRLKLAQAPERKQLLAERTALTKRLKELEPGGQRVSFTWLYENLAKGKAADER